MKIAPLFPITNEPAIERLDVLKTFPNPRFLPGPIQPVDRSHDESIAPAYDEFIRGHRTGVNRFLRRRGMNETPVKLSKQYPYPAPNPARSPTHLMKRLQYIYPLHP